MNEIIVCINMKRLLMITMKLKRFLKKHVKLKRLLMYSDASDVDGEEDDDDAVDDDENESETDDDNDDRNEITNLTFENPSQSDKSDNEATENNSMKCDSCVFVAPTMQRIEKHKCEAHSVPGNIFYFKCKREYDTRKEFNNHKYFGCF